jgi:PAS domain S-box-containing protein
LDFPSEAIKPLSCMRILLVDDTEAVRRGIRSLLTLRTDWLICGEAVDGLEALEKARSLRPDVILMDISMPRMNGLDATRIIREELPETKVVIVSQNEATIIHRQAQEVDAAACIAKNNLFQDLFPTLDMLARDLSAKSGSNNGGSERSSRLNLADTRTETAPGAKGGEKLTESIASQKNDVAAAAEPAEQTGLLAAIVDSSDDAIVSKNLNGIISSWNKSAERLFGYSAKEAIGQHITLIIPRAHRDEEIMIMERLKRGDRVEHFETVRMRKDGTTLDVSLTISPVKDGAGRVVGASKVARDITEQKRIERALRQSEDRLREVAQGLEGQVRIRTRELEQRNAEVLQQSEQLRGLSNRLVQTQDDERRRISRELHDSAGQILTALGLNLANITELARQTLPVDKAVEDSQELVQQLTKEIRTLSYLLHPPLLDENGLSQAILWYVQGLMERCDLKIELYVAQDFGRLSAEMELSVFRIVQESLTNIHRHSESKTAIIRLSRRPDGVSLEIQDAGKGISSEKLAGMLGQRFGVGITGMRERIRHFGGTMDIQSNEKGTKISVKLPVPLTAASEPDSVSQRTKSAG